MNNNSEIERERNAQTNQSLRRWGTTTKVVVITVLLILLGVVLYRFHEVIPPLMIAFLVAFILDPIVGFLTDRLHLSRGLATTLVFLILIVGMLGVVAAPVTAVPNIRRLVLSLQIDVIRIVADIGTFFDQPLMIGNYPLDLSSVYEELSATVTSFVGSVAQGTLNVVFNIASGAFWLVFILIAAFYLVKDSHRILDQLGNLAPPGYGEDVLRLRQQVTSVWNAFLRGQLVMGLVMFSITTIVCTAIGVPYAVVMGLIAGVMEFIPNLGPILALIPAVLVALFQGSNLLPLSNFWFAVVVTGAYIVIQQIEGNLILPRVMGNRLKLHPLVVLIGIIVGGNLGGILGMLLAAPVLATLRVVGYYVFCRLYDRDPFAEPEVETTPPEPSLLQKAHMAALDRLQEEIKQIRQRMIKGK